MKKYVLLFLLLFFGTLVSAQNLYLELSGTDKKDLSIIDSVGYLKIHPNAKSVVTEANAFSEKLKSKGYLSSEVLENTKTNDSTFLFIFKLGGKTKNIHIYIGKNSDVRELAFPGQKKDTVIVALSETEAFLNSALNILERKGYSLAQLQLVNLHHDNNKLFADLELNIGNLRQVNDIVINGYDKFPEGHKKQIKRLYKNKTFTQDNLKKIHADFEKFRFITQTKYPEILFTKDTTKVYVYLEKAKSNRFDGFIGFSNDEEEGKSKIQFQGYLDLLLVNSLNVGEEFSLYWKSDGKKQKTFNVGIELPYIFKSPFGLKASLNIFKQDSTYQNTKTSAELGYYFNYNTRLYIGYQATESSDIQNANTSLISDYKSTFFTSTFDYKDFKVDEFLFPEKTKMIIRAGVGSRKSKLERNGQVFGEINLMHNIYLNEKNLFNLKTQNFYLHSDTYIISELYRFGGINSIRGFNESSLQANLFTSLLTEYRYIFAPGMYLHSIIDYGYYADDSRNVVSGSSGSLLGLGFGFGFLTKTGLFNLVYANGSTDGQQIKLSNSIVHISFKASF